MLTKITAQFDSVDTATVALSHVKKKAKSLKEAKIIYHNRGAIEEQSFLSSAFLVPPLANGIMQSEVIGYPAMYAADFSNLEEKESTMSDRVRVSISVLDEEIKPITSTLRSFGAQHVSSAKQKA